MNLITYPSKITWLEIVTERADSELGKNNQSRIRSLLSKLSNTTITHTITPLTEYELDWFTPLYLAKINQKENPNVFDIYSTTIGKKEGAPYYILTLYEAGTPIGGTIFSRRSEKLSIAYRIYSNDWTSQTIRLQANPALYSEYLINKHAWLLGYKQISHGRDRNPYGINAQIGLAIFKLSIGCTPFLPKTPYDVCTLDLQQVSQDILVMEMPTQQNNKIEHAILYADKNGIDKFSSVTRYPSKLTVTVQERVQ